MGLSDPRSYGSGNPGATNVLRSGNKLAAILTLVGDAAKGAVAVLLAQAFAISIDRAHCLPQLIDLLLHAALLLKSCAAALMCRCPLCLPPTGRECAADGPLSHG